MTPGSRDYEAELLQVVEDFVTQGIDFDTLVKRFDNCYFYGGMPEDALNAAAYHFWNEVNEWITFTGHDHTIDEFREWLARVRPTYPAYED
jgi:hypothetical protein